MEPARAFLWRHVLVGPKQLLEHRAFLETVLDCFVTLEVKDRDPWHTYYQNGPWPGIGNRTLALAARILAPSFTGASYHAKVGPLMESAVAFLMRRGELFKSGDPDSGRLSKKASLRGPGQLMKPQALKPPTLRP